MPDELWMIDVVERIKRFTLAGRPALAEDGARRVEEFQSDHSIRYYKERFLAALSGANVAQPGALRELNRAVRLFEEEPEALERELIAEEPPFYARVGHKRRRMMARGLRAFDDWGRDPRESGRALGAALRECGRLEDALRLTRDRLPCPQRLDAYRILKAWNYPLLLPDRRRQTLLYRLGLLESLSFTVEGLRRAAEHGERLNRLSGEPLQCLDLALGAFAGAEPGQPAVIARCVPRPQCDNCPAASHCEYGKRHMARRAPPRRLTIKDWDARQRPRERLASLGPAALSESELIAILIRTGSASATALEVAQHLLRHYHGLKGLDEAAMAELRGVNGMGEVKAATLKAALELGKRFMGGAGDHADRIEDSNDVFIRYQHRFANVQQEQFHLICLNTKHQITRETLVSLGSLANSLVHPREAFKEAIRHSAAAVIFVHNHPSGDPAPSGKDREVTERLIESGKILGIPVLDHIVVGRNRYYSFQDERLYDMRPGGEDRVNETDDDQRIDPSNRTDPADG